MASVTSKVTIGAFTIGGLILFLTALIFLGGGNYFQDKIEYVLYFEGSVGGLRVGAPVVFRGVPLGNVTRISLLLDRSRSTVTIPVHIQINQESFTKITGETFSEKAQREIVRRMVEKGLSARLRLSNLVTSQSQVELDYHDRDSNVRTATRTTDDPNEIPTVPSPMDALQKSLANLPLQELTHSFNNILSGLSYAIGDGSELKAAIASFQRAFSSIEATSTAMKELMEKGTLRAKSEEILNNLSRLTADLARDLPRLMANLDATVSNFTQTADRLKNISVVANEIINRNSPAVQDVRRLLKEAAEAARSLHNLADMLNRNPEALLKGKQGGR